ncbi:hypothetical protein K466DRAFT_565845 [Polyporus arcularius HHB13444]|uniref:Uncharacterized protein n=1 Tax=Polyporus arcularius HHB13444 TaxID=1314778 RepID=A0A5C3PAD8_9APHY|nr:hypothetical protein K466DRAFT_565845 [Polyporus arcularius HHB13444]
MASELPKYVLNERIYAIAEAAPWGMTPTPYESTPSVVMQHVWPKFGAGDRGWLYARKLPAELNEVVDVETKAFTSRRKGSLCIRGSSGKPPGRAMLTNVGLLLERTPSTFWRNLRKTGTSRCASHAKEHRRAVGRLNTLKLRHVSVPLERVKAFQRGGMMRENIEMSGGEKDDRGARAFTVLALCNGETQGVVTASSKYTVTLILLLTSVDLRSSTSDLAAYPIKSYVPEDLGKESPWIQ